MLKRMKALLAATLAMAVVLPAAASTLGDAATQMKPGEWRVLNRSGDGAGFDYALVTACQPSGCSDMILNYADKGMWNPATREIEFIGKGHMAEHKHISYSEANNRWVQRPRPGWACGVEANCWGMGHGYEHSANNPATGDVYARMMSSGTVYKWTRASQSWAQIASGPVLEVAVALEYFPEMGGLLMIGTRNGTGEVHLYSESTKSWKQLASGLAMGAYHNVATYSAKNKVVIFGGGNGSKQLYRIDASGGVTGIASAPVGVGILQSILTVDPASGKYLLLGSGGGFYEYDVATNKWSTLSSTGAQQMFKSDSNRIWMRVAVPVSTHGVVAFLAEDGSNTRVMLYRHATGGGAPVDITPPAPPSGLSIQ
jgi:hypothetical protein